MTRGSCLAVTSPRVFEVATGETMIFEVVLAEDLGRLANRPLPPPEQRGALVKRVHIMLPSCTDVHNSGSDS